jgi:hypothetical protein
MDKIINQSDLYLYFEQFNKLSSSTSNPWIQSQQSKFLEHCRKIKIKTLEFEELKRETAYILLSGSGSFYCNNNSVGYFMQGSIVIINDINLKDETAEALIHGSTFRVTQDTSFANTSSEFNISEEMSSSGDIHKHYFMPQLMTVADALIQIKSFLILLNL